MAKIKEKLLSFARRMPFTNDIQRPNQHLPNYKEWNPKQALDNLKEYLENPLIPIKNAAYTERNIGNLNNDYYVQKDPYLIQHKHQFEEALRADGIVARALERKADFVFAKGFKCVLDLTEQFEDDEERRSAFEKIMSNAEYKKARKLIDKVNKTVNFRFYCRAGYINAKGYGRSALLKESIDEETGLPASLYILASKLLGNIYCDTKTKKIAFVEYNTDITDSQNTKIYYEPEDLVYFTNRDYSISPNTYGYGLSEVEPVKDISETNRIYDEIDLKEMARSLWAGYLILQAPNVHNEEEINNLLSTMEPGKPTVISTDIIPTVIDVAKDMEDIVEARNQNDRRILREIGLPSFALGFETDANRATSQFVLYSWKESFIEQERIWLRDIINRDWLEPMWAKILNKDIDEVRDLDATATLEFIDYSFDTKQQQVATYLPLYEMGLMSNVDFLERIGEKELAAKTKELKQNFLLLQQQMNNSFGGAGAKKPGSSVKMDPEQDFSRGGGEASDVGTGL